LDHRREPEENEIEGINRDQQLRRLDIINPRPEAITLTMKEPDFRGARHATFIRNLKGR